MHALYLLALLSLSVLCGGRELPSFINRCRKEDPKLNECMKKALIDIKPYLQKGIPEMRLPQSEPFHVENVKFKSGDFEVVLIDSNLYNLVSYEVTNLEVDLSKKTISLTLHLPIVKLVSSYNMTGKLLFLQMEGTGNMEANFTDIEGFIKLYGKKQERNGKSYIKFETMDHDLKIGNCHAYFSDLFKNNPEIGQRTNDVLNDNMQELLKEFGPLFDKTVAPVVFSLFQVVFIRYSIDELFL